MKRFLLSAAVLVLLAGGAPFLCLLPWFSAAPDKPAPAAGVPTVTAAPAEVRAASTPTPAPDPAAQIGADEPVLLYDAAAGQTRSVPVRDFLVGVAACELPSDWPDAAIQAQMVAAHSYALYCRDHAADPAGGWLTVNSATGSGWTDDAALQARWGDDYTQNHDRLTQLADRVAGVLLVYGGQPAMTCYHAISSGHTEASQNVWAEALPYLQGVDSAWDRYSDDFEVTIEYTADQFTQAVAELDLTPEGDPGTWVGESRWDKAGYITSIDLCGQSVSGTAVRRALDLRSACFAIAWRGGQFVITTRGYGHGVGLSQYGARTMAEGGATWREILTYYFPGCEVQEENV